MKEQKRRGVKEFKRSGEEIGNRVRKTQERRRKGKMRGEEESIQVSQGLRTKNQVKLNITLKKKDEFKEVIEKEMKGEKSTEIHTDL